ncbi:MAG: DUF1080 domain-containing protein [Chthonomonas sp.]|nr:DUF1080 domain-containing protein [Chthonomonas sp.]
MRAFGLAVMILVASVGSAKEWQSLFNGKNLDGWTPKIKGYPAGDNFGKTFRVNKGVIQVGYEGYGGKFADRFGHLFYKTPFSRYILRMEYRFFGDQLPDGPGWAWRNSGVMIHSQSADSMALNQDFPVSAEVQFLGGAAEGDRHTGNLCTPGTNVVRDGKIWTPHCWDSTSPTLRGDVWVKAEVEVHGNGAVIHRINGKEVIRYEQVQYDPNDADAKRLVPGKNLQISSGYIALQSESHPIEFRRIEIKQLQP